MSFRSRFALSSNIAVFELPTPLMTLATRLVGVNRFNEDLASDRVSIASIQSAVACRFVVKLLIVELPRATLLEQKE